MGTLRATKDYSLFILHEINRDVEKVANLEKSMETHGWIDAYPMHVIKSKNGKMKIKAGHHRFATAKKLGIAVKFVVCDDMATIHELEMASSKWSMTDFLNSYVRDGRKSYIAVKEYVDRTGIRLMNAVSMLGGDSAGSNNKHKEFKDGIFQLGDPTHANMVAAMVGQCEKSGIEFFNSSLLVRAFSKVCWADGFCVKTMLNKIKTFSYLFERQPSMAGYVELLDMIYNRQAQNKIPLKFLAEAKARERNPYKG